MNKIHPSPCPSPRGRGEKKTPSPFPSGKGVRGIGLLTIFILQSSIFNLPAWAVDTLRVTAPDPVLEQWRWTTFDRSSGLAGPVRDMFEDRDGNIWFATDQGAQRYDGMRWTTYTTKDGLGHNQVRTITQTRDGAMWFGTYGGGVSRYDGKTHSAGSGQAWVTYTTKDGLASNFIWWRGLQETRDGVLWAGFCRDQSDTTGAYSGISRFDGQRWTTMEVPGELPRPNIMDIHQASDGSLWFTTWFSTLNYGILRFDGSRWTRLTRADGLAGDKGVEILESRDGSIWVACWTQGISRFVGGRWKTYTDRDGLPKGNGLTSLWQTEDGTIWAGSGNGTLYRFDGERWKAYTREEVPQFNRLLFGRMMRGGTVWLHNWGEERAFRLDFANTKWKTFVLANPLSGGYSTPDGAVWFHTRSEAVRYDREGRRPGESSEEGTWLRYAPKDGLIDAPVYRMGQTDDGSLWFFSGTSGKFQGLSRYDRGTWRRYSKEEVGLDNVSDILRAKDGSFWFGGSRDGASAASRYDGQSWKVCTREDGLVGNGLSSIRQTENGDLWFATKGSPTSAEGDGVLRYDGKRWTSYTTRDGLAHNRIYSLFQTPDGRVWAGALTGLSWFDPSTGSGQGGRSWQSYTSADGLPGESPSGFVMHNSDLWFCYPYPYSAGVTRYDGKTWRTYTTQDGLVDNRVRGIHRAADGALWFRTDGGVSRFDGSNWASYTAEDGLPGNHIVQIWQSPDGTLWFLTNDGKAGTFTPDNVGPETVIQPAPEKVSSVGNILLKWSGRDRWDDTSPRNLRYQWRMNGGAWSSWSSWSDYTFTELASGRHTVEVRAVDRDGNVEPTPAVHAFVVEAPWWENPYVLGLMAVLLGLAGVQTGRIVQRDRQLQEQNRQLVESNRQVQQANQAKSAFLANMSHELRTPLNSVIGMSDILMEKYFGDLTPQQEDYLKDIRESGQHLLSLINDVLDLSKVEAGHSPLELSKVDIKPLLENSLTIVRERAMKHGIALSCEAPEDLPEIVADERKVKQAVFNLLSNAVKFTPDGGRVGIEARLVHGRSETEKRRNGETEKSSSPVPRFPDSPAPGWVEVVVVDTGIGIGPEDQGRVFGEFVQAEASLTKQYEGTGLGLALVKRFVEQHGGRVWLESEVGKGSKFYFTLPVEPTSPSPSLGEKPL